MDRLFQQARKNAWGYAYVAPWVVLYLVFGLYPLGLSFYLSFFTYSFTNPDELRFVGLGNWVRAASDPLFWKSVFNIFYNQSIFILLKNSVALAAALLLTQVTVGARFFRTVYFLPTLISVVVLMQIGGFMVAPNGPAQALLIRLGILEGPFNWQFSLWWPMPVLAVINTWKWFGVATVIFLAGLVSIPKELYEAAAIDGATPWQRFCSITWPLLNPQILFILVIDVINGLQMFAEVFLLYDIKGGPQHQGLTPVLYLYAQAFGEKNIGYASSLGLLLAVVIAVFTWLQFRVVRRDIG